MALTTACTTGPQPAPTAHASTSTATGPATAGNLQDAYEHVVTQILPTVVQITTSAGLGSGIVYDTKGDIVTNDHVVGTSRQFQVTLATGGATLTAHLLAAYTPDDLAVITLDTPPANLRPAVFADSTSLRTGEIVMAVGNPLGLSGSVTQGIISATGRTVSEPQAADSPGATIADAIQTSANINPGNSGGALVNLDAHVVGIPTLAATDPQMGGAAPGIGFAIPSNTVTTITAQIIKNGAVTNSHRAALDATVRTIADTTGQPTGVAVVTVTQGGAADKAGLTPGDVITAVEHTPTPTTTALAQILAQHQPDDHITVSLTHPDGSKADLPVVLGQLA